MVIGHPGAVSLTIGAVTWDLQIQLSNYEALQLDRCSWLTSLRARQ